ncbi:MAG: 3-keto-5-aminohexanoate cleavage protein [Nocardioides sp.]
MTTSSSTRGRSCANSTSSARSAAWCRSSSSSTSARCTRCSGCWDTFGLPAGGRVHCDLVMGVPGGMNGTAEALVAAVAALPPATTSWSATGIGRSTLAVALAFSPRAVTSGWAWRTC